MSAVDTSTDRIADLEQQVQDLTMTVERLIDHVNRYAMNTEAVWPESHPMFVHEHVMTTWHDEGDDWWFVDCSCNLPSAGDGFASAAEAEQAMALHADATGGEVADNPSDPRIFEYHQRGSNADAAITEGQLRLARREAATA